MLTIPSSVFGFFTMWLVTLLSEAVNDRAVVSMLEDVWALPFLACPPCFSATPVSSLPPVPEACDGACVDDAGLLRPAKCLSALDPSAGDSIRADSRIAPGTAQAGALSCEHVLASVPVTDQRKSRRD